eukprot:1197902-Prymnesium_polylepis.1
MPRPSRADSGGRDGGRYLGRGMVPLAAYTPRQTSGRPEKSRVRRSSRHLVPLLGLAIGMGRADS